MIVRPQLEPVTDPSDPDDWRPQSLWALAASPDVPLTVILEEIAPGDRIPLHRHTIDEVVVYARGSGSVTLDDTTREIAAGDVVFIRAGTRHGTRNTGREPLCLTAVFPAHVVDIEYLDRNPAPGTEDDPPRPPVAYDARTGEVTAASARRLP